MTAESTRTLKEARALLYPWCAMMMLCFFPILSRPGQFMYFLFQIGLTLGVPLMACLSFGNEFRHKTMDLLVSQPVDRLKIWREKWHVVAIAVLTTTLVAGVTSRTPWHITEAGEFDIVIFFVVTTCSAPFWTLLGRSTLGGLVLNIAAFILLYAMKADLWFWNFSAGYVSPAAAVFVLSIAILGYSALMLWLGRSILVRRQSGEGFAGPDVMASIPNLLPARIVSWFQCRPDQVLLNLIRRDLRLLRPLWLLMVLYVLGWSTMAVSFSFVPAVGELRRTVPVILVLVTATYPIIAIFLAASLPMGEERAFGVQLWHLALPLSIRTQWLARLLSGLIAAVLCAVAVPAALEALAQTLLRPDFMGRFTSMTMIEPMPSLLAFFLFAFWCAIVARDLTRTAGLIAVSAGMMFVAVQCGIWLTERFAELFEYLLTFVVSWFQLNPFMFYGRLSGFPNLAHIPQWELLAVLCLLMTAHTYPLFRRLPQENAFKMVRPLVPYIVLVLMFVSLMTIRSRMGGLEVAHVLFYDTEKAIAKLHPTNTFTVEDLAKASALQVRTQRWLRNSRMNVSVSDLPVGSWRPAGGNWKVYNLTIELGSGTTCEMPFLFDLDKPPNYFPNFGKCH